MKELALYQNELTINPEKLCSVNAHDKISKIYFKDSHIVRFSLIYPKTCFFLQVPLIFFLTYLVLPCDGPVSCLWKLVSNTE